MSQKEIAERLNLSRTTVSRCFTNHPKINPETRARVFELAAEIGYSYSPPRNLVEDRPRVADSVAVMVGRPSNALDGIDTARQIYCHRRDAIGFLSSTGDMGITDLRYQHPAFPSLRSMLIALCY